MRFLFLAVTFLSAVKALAQPLIVNPGFEADPTPPYPGYGSISGWSPGGELVDGFGLNEANGPFADNGLVPEGTHVAFVQDNGELVQNVNGFVPGVRYRLGFYENARGLCCGERAATLAILIKGAPIVPEHVVPIAGANNPFKFVLSNSFTADSSTLALTIVKGGFGDSTALIDDFQIFEEALALSITANNENIPLIRIQGVPDWRVILEFTKSLTPDVVWHPLTIETLESDPTVVPDATARTDAPRFYRARLAE